MKMAKTIKMNTEVKAKTKEMQMSGEDKSPPKFNLAKHKQLLKENNSVLELEAKEMSLRFSIAENTYKYNQIIQAMNASKESAKPMPIDTSKHLNTDDETCDSPNTKG